MPPKPGDLHPPASMRPGPSPSPSSMSTPAIFLTRSGRRVPDADTDQPGSALLVRTVSCNADGTRRDRPAVAVSPELTRGDAEGARLMADDLDRRGYLPPDPPMTERERQGLPAVGATTRAVIWEVLGRGVPLGTALERAGVPASQRRNQRRRVQRWIVAIGWGEMDGG